jgi:hypothetical protein
MKVAIRMVGLLCALLCVNSVAAQGLSLNADLGVRGILRYCEYSDGKVYTLDASKPCPASVPNQPAPTGRGTGNLMGEEHDGGTKLCIYNVSGMERRHRIDANGLCPLNHTF